MIFTGSYDRCEIGNLVSISGDRGKSVGFKGNAYLKLAPKMKFWKVWHDNIDKISKKENTRYYVENYYNQVLKSLDPKDTLDEIIQTFGKNPILLCYENEGFCHRFIPAVWFEEKLGIKVPEISINKNCDIKGVKEQESIKEEVRELLLEIMEKGRNIRELR